MISMRNQICIINYPKPWSKQSCLFDLLCKPLAENKPRLLDFPLFGGQRLARIAETSQVAGIPPTESGDAAIA
jgi:hypothetical protein